MRLETLSLDKAEALLQFEIENRQWFESYIEARSNQFYRLKQVEQHIQDYLYLAKKELLYPALIIEQQTIVARANLRINPNQPKNASIGYRVAKEAVNRGIATFACQRLIEVAKHNFALTTLNAFVSTSNPASQKVLERQGFVISSYHPKMALVKGKKLDCQEFQKSLK